MSPPTPRLFLIRHGETEWSLNGRHTGTSDIPLTTRGEEQIKSKAHILVGEGKPIDPKNLCVALVSPRQRAHRTFHLLFEHVPKVPDHLIDESVREWDYGKYEGMLKHDILAIDPEWDIWRDGCPGGESAEDMCARVDSVVAKVREYHRQYFEEGKGTRDVLIVAHGHFNRVFISRWIRFDLALGTHFNVEPGGVSILSYNHSSLDEPALNALNLYADVK
ncbi:phosphoglycerate mutase-like protein [Rhizopogon vinicolor AM-OR11-026]|uniref:Phosphoglycerate mutase-like protein n=1 Tax=Rhizopogon vinicolor AM-OR11-026 TaxID=1314800 RepID=A0A1B7NHJ4_9AGAM|nr:phosphoglycerate mutase-like protein [Rhizopogon vinicolor AM-OR11-026]